MYVLICYLLQLCLQLHCKTFDLHPMVKPLMVFGPARASLVSGLVLVVRVCFGRNVGLVPS